MVLRRLPSPRCGLAIALVTIAHATLSVGSLMLAFAMVMARFETGARASWREPVLDAIVAVLHSPVLPMLASAPARWFAGLWGYLPVLLNSFIWAIVIVSVARWLRARRPLMSERDGAGRRMPGDLRSPGRRGHA